jgi:hypothetical protein
MKKKPKPEIEINIFNDFIDWLREQGPAAIKERIASIAQEYPLAVLEGQTEERAYPDAPRNLRFLQEFLFQLYCLESELEPKKN